MLVALFYSTFIRDQCGPVPNLRDQCDPEYDRQNYDMKMSTLVAMMMTTSDHRNHHAELVD